MSQDPITIAGIARTPHGGLLGDLKDATAAELGCTAIRAAVERSQLTTDDIEEVIMGCVLPAGQGQAPARQAALTAGLKQSTPCTTINKMCGSGMKAIMFAHDQILAGTNQIIVAGGMESMSNAPYLIDKARTGFRLGHGEIKDHMFLDGLEDAYDKGRLMGEFAEQTAQHFKFSRIEQDQFAIESLKRAQQAITDGAFSEEIINHTVKTRKSEITIDTDEQPTKAKIDKISQLRPAFSKTGTVTAANSSSISDGAAAVVLLKQSEAYRRQLKPLAKIHAHASHAQAPAWFTTAPVGAIKKVLEKAQWQINDVDLFEINEAFAVVTMAAMRELDISHDQVNVHGGACALGHPIGASGARIVVSLITALRRKNLKRGIAALCIGGGEATAIALELCD